MTIANKLVDNYYVPQFNNQITIKSKISNILIITKIYDLEPILDTKTLVKYLLLLKEYGINIYIQDKLKMIKEFGYNEILEYKETLKSKSGLKFWNSESFTFKPDLFDLVITMGGDGTVLFASLLFQSYMPPVLSFGLGSLGFLTDYQFENHQEILGNMIKNGFHCSVRRRFQCTVMRSDQSRIKNENENENINANKNANKNDKTLANGKQAMISLANIRDLSEEIARNSNNTDYIEDSYNFHETHKVLETYIIFNDIVFDRGPNSTMTSIDLYGDFEPLTTIEADGCVIATPSGSTAYSLSAGGSLVHPEIPGVLISPICPHTLSLRPLIIPETITLRVGVPYNSRSTVWCSFDGKNRIELKNGDFVTITPSRYPLSFVKNNTSKLLWFKRLSDTLNWNERKKQKPMTKIAIDNDNNDDNNDDNDDDNDNDNDNDNANDNDSDNGFLSFFLGNGFGFLLFGNFTNLKWDYKNVNDRY
ncbi:ATP-NAD kinase [Ascoidea rubescens DSM 1968]|uniref:ATP-NAD kinase n=1 Tax=Ascoidea rubescens DSM 1968 TaxID=1344418 RepID=A0A1D2VHK6_9ASCO|nr:ATP-NAD kinase [Ascoidea rubescens DSM 1968]ODV61151.1 ATP-NAD kinase [Ascoidea rubescens DSM 1968]